MSWVKWSQVCKPKAKGGLGVKNLYLFNLALLSKWRWRMLNGNNEALWLRVLEARYGSMRPWFGNPLPVNVARKTSLWWRDLACLGEDTQLGLGWFKEVTKKRIGNGASVKFWYDIWLGTEPLAAVFPSIMACHNDKEASVADMGVWVDSGWKWKWYTHGTATVFASGLGGSNESVMRDFVEFFQGVQLSTTDDDRWIWLIDSPRGFTVKSCYNWICNRVGEEVPQFDDSVIGACKSLWKSDLPLKVLVFCWRLLLRKLPTRDKLLTRGIISSSQGAVCVLCQKEVETSQHLFCNCDVVKQVWRGLFSWLNVQGLSCEDEVLMFEGVGDVVKGKSARRVKFIFWAAVVYQVWLARNNVIFNNKVASVNSIVNSIKVVSWGWFIARKGKSSGLSFSDWFSCPLGCISSL